MSSSYFDILRDVMPLAAFEYEATSERPFEQLEIADANSRLFYLLPGESYPPQRLKSGEPPAPELRAIPHGDPQEHWENQPLWSFLHNEDDPATVNNVWCRVRHAKYRSHLVLESIQWGHEDPTTHTFKQVVKVFTTAGDEIELPLTKAFVDARWAVVTGAFGEDSHPLWPLKALLDKGLVVAFVYELDADNTPRRWRDVPPKDDDEKRAREKFDEANLAISSKAPPPRAELPPSDESSPISTADAPTAPSSPDEPWGAKIRHLKLMPNSPDGSVVGGEIPSTSAAASGPVRILVVLSLATFKERADFEPGGVAGMGKIFPHIMVKANIPLCRIEATVRLDRPEKTTPREPSDASGAEEVLDCCKQFDEMDPFVNALLVADDNDGPGLVPSSFWGDIFGYYQTDAFQHLGSTPLHVVRTDRCDNREAGEPLVVRDVVMSNPFSDKPFVKLTKMARQGEFDNVHLAPKMRVKGATHALFGDQNMVAIDPSALGLDDVTMAPFCAHDCLHIHFRWGRPSDQKWVLGWDSTGPYRKAGAPMVPEGQDVTIWFRSRHALSYHAQIGQAESSPEILRSGTWQIVMYHGGAYAVEISAPAKFALAQGAVDIFAVPALYRFKDGVEPKGERVALGTYGMVWNGDPITKVESSAALYWASRFSADCVETPGDASQRVVTIERVRFTADSLLKLRSL